MMAAAAAMTAALMTMLVAVLMAMAMVVIVVAAVAMVMIMIVMTAVAMIMGMTFTVEMVVLMGVLMVVLVGVCVGMAVGNTVVGVLVLMGVFMLVGVCAGADMIVVQMHSTSSFCIFSLLYWQMSIMSKYLFFRKIPLRGLRRGEKNDIIAQNRDKGGVPVADHHHDHDHVHDHHDHDHDHTYMHAHGIAHSHGHVHENQKAVVNRLARAVGHLEKVKRMVEEGYDCSEVLVQLAAVRSALDNTGKVILQDHLRHCMVDAVAAGDETAIDELCTAIDKFMK